MRDAHYMYNNAHSPPPHPTPNKIKPKNCNNNNKQKQPNNKQNNSNKQASHKFVIKIHNSEHCIKKQNSCMSVILWWNLETEYG